MKKALYLIIYIPLLLLASCDVHELPTRDNVGVPFFLHLDFNSEMPLYKEIPYTRTDDEEATKAPAYLYNIRYTIKAYRTDITRGDAREADATFVFTQPATAALNFTAPLELPEGEYDFQIWTDYVDAGTIADKFYNTSDFSEIILSDRKNHRGSEDFRDAYRGYTKGKVLNPEYYLGDVANSIDNQAFAEMRRPMGKFKFVATDVESFVTRVIEMMKEKGKNKNTSFPTDSIWNTRAEYERALEYIGIEQFKVVFRYNLFMPCSFNMFTDKPADSWTGMTFESNMYSEDYNEMTLGFDYIFVNGSETTLSVSLEVYDEEGQLLSSTDPINVPVVRSKLTLVTGSFLTSKAAEGVSISPGFDGEFNIPIQ